MGEVREMDPGPQSSFVNLHLVHALVEVLLRSEQHLSKANNELYITCL
jgi:hypothetical protein